MEVKSAPYLLARFLTLSAYPSITHCSKLKMNGIKTKPVPILLLRASRNFPDVKIFL